MQTRLQHVRAAATSRLSQTRTRTGFMGFVGMFLLIISVGPLFFLLNGGFSIQGMEWLTTHLGPYGRMFWAIATFWTFEMPILARARLPTAQPILPWLFVVAMSCLQIALLLRWREASITTGLLASGGGTSVFDYLTTAIGLVVAPFALTAGLLWYLWVPIALFLAVPVTFGLEFMVTRFIQGR